jgi:hypothetical protein
MAMTFKGNMAHLEGTVGAEQAEILLGWLQKHPKGKLNLTECTHIHAAQLQVLMAAKTPVSEWPKDESLTKWLKSALT